MPSFHSVPELIEALAMFEAFRRVGYPADDLFLTLSNHDEGVVIGIECRWDQRKMDFTIGKITMSHHDVVPMWEQASMWWNRDASEYDRQLAFKSSFVYRNSTDFATRLSLAGMLRIERKSNVWHEEAPS